MTWSESAPFNFDSKCVKSGLHITFNRTKGRILPALQPGQEAEGADGKEICCTDYVL